MYRPYSCEGPFTLNVGSTGNFEHTFTPPASLSQGIEPPVPIGKKVGWFLAVFDSLGKIKQMSALQ